MGSEMCIRDRPKACIEALHSAVDEMDNRETFRGYGPEAGYDFLREAIAENDFAKRGVNINSDEIFVSDGAKCDTANILDILGHQNKIAITDPVYPVYLDTNVMAGHTGRTNSEGQYEGITYLPCTAENQFVPALPAEKADIIYLCYPNNPTGATATKEQLTNWVTYAKQNNALILFDAAYEALTEDDVEDTPIDDSERSKLIERLEKEMKQAAARLDFERAAALRDRIYQMQTSK